MSYALAHWDKSALTQIAGEMDKEDKIHKF